MKKHLLPRLALAVVMMLYVICTPLSALAAEQDYSITVKFIQGAKVELYRALDMDGKLAGDFAKSGITVGDLDDDENVRALTDKLAAYAADKENSIAPVATKTVTAANKAEFSGLQSGIYLIVPSAVRYENTIYTPQASLLVRVPYATAGVGVTKAVEVDVKKFTTRDVVDITVTKKWVDDVGQYPGYTRPASVRVQLYNGENEYSGEIVLNESNNWTYTWTDLDASGDWSVKEITTGLDNFDIDISPVNGETNSYVITNTLKTVECSVTKVWADDIDADSHASVKAQLYNGDVKYGEPVVLSADNDWSYKWTGLYYNGDWNVKEADIPDEYIAGVEGKDMEYVITNTLKPVECSVEKVWDDNDAPDRPEYVEVQLYNGNVKYGDPVKLSDANEWKHTWKDLSADGEWLVKEFKTPDGYLSKTEQDGNKFVITNELIPKEPDPETADYTVVKVWDDHNNPERPSSVTVQLYNEAEPYGEPIVLSDENNWTYTWKDLDAEGSWNVSEIDIPEEYAVRIEQNGTKFTITNIYPPTVECSVEKIWDDDDNPDRPESVKAQLLKDGEVYGDPIELCDDNGWKYLWQGLDAASEWTVKEIDTPDSYQSETEQYGNRFVITNKLIVEEPDPETADYTVVKVWDDHNNPERPDSVTVQLYNEAEPYGEPIVLSDENNWTYTWEGLDAEGNWSVSEIGAPRGYEIYIEQEDTQFTVTNIYPPTVECSVEKIWDDDDNPDRPESVTVQLYNGEEEYGEPVILSDENEWTYTWEGLDAYGEWNVREINVPDGYTAEKDQDGNKFVITNKLIEEPLPETVDYSVSKVWDDNDNPDRPVSVMIQLYKDSKAYGDPVILDDNNGWKYTWEELDALSDWDVRELSVPEGYEMNKDQSGTSFVITNKLKTPELVEPVPENPDDPVSPPPSDVGGNGNETPTGTDGGEDENKLPQTGQLWWPVPVMLIAGAVIVLVGVVAAKKGKDENS